MEYKRQAEVQEKDDAEGKRAKKAGVRPSPVSLPENEPGKKEEPLRDKWKMVYVIFVIHGVATLLPWVMFTTAYE